MIKAYVLINVQIGAIPEVIRNLYSVSTIKSAEMTFGIYDVIAVVEVSDVKALAHTVSQDIQTIPGILQTTTCMAVDIRKSS